ncbi:MAG: PQQ-binding-like beta-propeller repeat protein [Alphaproteobacteria bacterium]|nr:PQQ-binding-like beta-propeller repeat protein [Alphaproteobacteria bacterium]
MWPFTLARLCLVVGLALGIAGCGNELAKDMFGKDKERLPGERISVMLSNPDLDPDPLISDLQVVLPPPSVNADWPQPGGNASHSMQHLALSDAPAEAWDVDIGSGSSSNRQLLASPIVAEGMIYTKDAEGEIRAFNADTGEQAWAVELSDEEEEEGHLGGGIAFADQRLFVTTGFAKVIALDAKTGAEIWRERAPAPMRAGPTVADGRVFALTVDNRLVVLSADDGRVMWVHTGIAEVAGILGGASPAVADGVVVVPHSSGELFGLRVETGRPIWSDTLAAIRRIDAVSQLSDIRGHPVVDSGLVIAMSHSGRMVAIDLRTGGRIWDKQIGSIQAPWTAGDYIYAVSPDGLVFCILREQGRIRWVRQLQRFEDEDDQEDPIVWAGPVVASDRLIVAGSHGEALSISPYTGDLTGRIELPDDVMIAPIVANNTLFFLTDDARLVAFR